MTVNPHADATAQWDWTQARYRCLKTAMSLLRCRADAEEAVQEALTRAWRHADSCRDQQNPLPWILTITRRECARTARKRSERQEAGYEACGEQSAYYGAAGRLESTLDLRSAVAELPEEERALIRLRYTEQLTQAEVATALELPEGTVKTRLHRIRARIRSRLEAEN